MLPSGVAVRVSRRWSRFRRSMSDSRRAGATAHGCPEHPPDMHRARGGEALREEASLASSGGGDLGSAIDRWKEAVDDASSDVVVASQYWLDHQEDPEAT